VTVAAVRKARGFERAGPWLGIAIGLSLLGAGAVALVATGVITDPWGSDVRGYTLTGMLLGALVVVLWGATFAYSLRKRALQESALGGGTMMSWLWLHVTLGLVSLVLAVMHAGFGVVSYPLSTGKLLFWCFALLTLSGIVWRIFYRVVPPRAAARIGNYSREGHVARATELTSEIESLAAGRSEPFRQVKDWLCAAPRAEHELGQAVGALPADDQRDLHRVWRLAESRRRALARQSAVPAFRRKLQIWRLVHVPLALCTPVLLVAHIVGATRLPTRMMPMGASPLGSLSGFTPSSACKDCHAAIYKQWEHSMHAHAMRSPLMVAQNNEVLRTELAGATSPDPKLVCVNCHGPVGVALTEREQATLPLERGGYDEELLMDGVGCTTCHQLLVTDPGRGEAGLARFQEKLDPVGDVYYGPFADPVGNSYHQSRKGEIFARPDKLCVACHNVVYDLNGDGKIEKGVDLILQETTKEYDRYRQKGGGATCLDCHMPVDKARKRSADGATLFLDQDREAPERVTRDHSFVAVDYHLDLVSKKDPQRERRQKLLRRAATLAAEIKGGKLVVSITNTGAGHNLPTGFAFARQTWLEVKMLDGTGRTVFGSGVLARPSDDLCDAATLDEDNGPLAKLTRGCEGGPDPQLVNYQLRLVDRIEILRDKNNEIVRDDYGEAKLAAAEGAVEATIQRIKGGAVVRVRPEGKQALAPLEPGETRTHGYRIAGGTRSISVRLLVRSLPPYFLRGLDAARPADAQPRLEPLIQNLQVEEMARVDVKL
jgi:hypothetical protein